MRIYLDSSALVKRVVDESESDALRAALRQVHAGGALFMTSAIALIEVSRVIRVRLDDVDLRLIVTAGRDAFAGVGTAPVSEPIVESARIIGPPVLRTLDAIHLATAVAVGADEVWTYDLRMAQTAEGLGIPVRMPQ